jgi:hypothetical protein
MERLLSWVGNEFLRRGSAETGPGSARTAEVKEGARKIALQRHREYGIGRIARPQRRNGVETPVPAERTIDFV